MESIQKAVSNVMNSQKGHEKNAGSSSPSLADNVSATAKQYSTTLCEKKDAAKDVYSSSPSLADSASASAKKCSNTLSDKKDATKDAVASEADKASEGASCTKGKCESKAAEVSDCASKKYSGEKSGEGSCGGSSCA